MKRKTAPRPNPIRREEDEPLPVLPSIVDDPISDEDDDTLASILQQHGSKGVQLKVYKVDDTGQDCYCHTFQDAVDDLEEAVRKLRYGAGRYRVKVIISGVFRAVIPISFAELQQTNGGPQQAASDPTVQLLREQLARQETLIQQLILKGQGNGGEKTDIGQLVDALSRMQQMGGGGMSADTTIKLIELGKSLGGGNGEDTSLMSIIKEVAPAVLPALMAGRSVPVPDTRGGATPLPMRTVTPSTPVTEGQDVNLIEAAMLKAGIAFLKKKCMAGSDPMLYVHLIADNADDAKYQKLISSVLNEDFSTFVSHDSEIGKEPFEKFFRAIYDGLRSAFSGEDSVEPNPGGTGGDHADIARDVSPGAKRGGE